MGMDKAFMVGRPTDRIEGQERLSLREQVHNSGEHWSSTAFSNVSG